MRIVIALHSPSPSTVLIRELRAITGIGLSDIRTRLRTGVPLIDLALFMNDHHEIAAMVRGVLRTAEVMSSEIDEVTIREVMTEQDAESMSERITAEIARNILDRHDETLRRFDR